MTNAEMLRLSEMIASNLAKRMKEDDELLERIYPSRPLNTSEAAEWLGIPAGTFSHRTKEIPHVKIGKRTYFNKRDLTRWFEKFTNSGVAL